LYERQEIQIRMTHDKSVGRYSNVRAAATKRTMMSPTNQLSTMTQRTCPQCKTASEEEYLQNIHSRIDRLTKQKSLLEIEIDQLIREAEVRKKTIKE